MSQASGCIGADLSTESVIKLFEAKPDMVFTEAVEVLRKVSAWAGVQAEEAMELLVVGYPPGGVARGRLPPGGVARGRLAGWIVWCVLATYEEPYLSFLFWPRQQFLLCLLHR